MFSLKTLTMRLSGSLQNPAFSPDSETLVFTRFRKGYNKPPADIFLYDLVSGKLRAIAQDGHENVSQPGACWNAIKNAIVFSTDSFFDIDWPAIYHIGTDKLDKLTSLPYRPGRMGYEPSWAPDGNSIVYEEHPKDDEEHGQIVVLDLKSGVFSWLTHGSDCRQPNWSPSGKLIVWQRRTGPDDWVLDLYDVKLGKKYANVYPGTDATFGPHDELVFSDPNGALAMGGHGIIPADRGRYCGAPSIAPNGRTLACETSVGSGEQPTHLALVFLNQEQANEAILDHGASLPSGQ